MKYETLTSSKTTSVSAAGVDITHTFTFDNVVGSIRCFYFKSSPEQYNTRITSFTITDNTVTIVATTGGGTGTFNVYTFILLTVATY